MGMTHATAPDRGLYRSYALRRICETLGPAGKPIQSGVYYTTNRLQRVARLLQAQNVPTRVERLLRAQGRLQYVVAPAAGAFGLALVMRARPAERQVQGLVLTRWVFLRLLGVTYLCAFTSYAVQVDGLIGSRGVLPAAEYLDAVRRRFGRAAYWNVPTLALVDASDRSLWLLCRAGAGLSLALIAGVAPAPVLVGLWVCYQSLVAASQEFLGYQWDVLLLETGLLSIFYAPLNLLPGIRRETAPPRVVVWLLRLLCFRLMFFSGVVKVASGDVTWRSLMATTYHYETQPLPTPLAWYAHQLPPWLHVVETALVFALELAGPFLALGPRRARLAGAASITWLMLLIMLTGNYAFFNWLAVTLCVPLLDDDLILQALPRRLRARLGRAPNTRASLAQRAVALPVAAAYAGLSLLQFVDLTALGRRMPAALRRVAYDVAPFHVVNRYGLFAVMTTTRPEIVVEGSDDGRHWQPYEFRYKPGDVDRAPAWVAPHQPRLDWQMWFAALQGPTQARWFGRFLARLLQGEPAVIGLLAHNPFAERPPRYVRAMLYDYRFTRRGEAGTAWWQREELAMYYPPVSLR